MDRQPHENTKNHPRILLQSKDTSYIVTFSFHNASGKAGIEEWRLREGERGAGCEVRGARREARGEGLGLQIRPTTPPTWRRRRRIFSSLKKKKKSKNNHVGEIQP